MKIAIKQTEESELLKALGHKYIKKITVANGKSRYFYKTDFAKPFKALATFFGVKQKNIDTVYEKNDISKTYGADKPTFAKHVLEYLVNRTKWDALFTKNTEVDKKPVKQKNVKTTEAMGETKAEQKAPSEVKQSNKINRSLIKKIYSIYNGIDNEFEEHENRSEAMQGNQNAKKDNVTEESKKIAKEEGVKAEKRKEAGLPKVDKGDRQSAIDDVADDTLDPNSPNYRYRDTGYIAGSRKEAAEVTIKQNKKDGRQTTIRNIDLAGLEENPRAAEQYIIKSNCFGEVDWGTLKDGGMTGGAAFLIDRVYASLGAKPAENDAEGRKNYLIALDGVRGRMEVCKTVEEVNTVLYDIRNEIRGSFVTARQTEEYLKVNEEYQKAYEYVRDIQKEHDKQWNSYYNKRNELQGYIYDSLKRKRISNDEKYHATIETLKKYGTEEQYNKAKEMESTVERLNKIDDEFRKKHFPYGLASKKEYKFSSGGTRSYSSEEEKKSFELEDKLSVIELKNAREIIASNPLYNAWVSLGSKFLGIQRSEAFQTHKRDARMGKYDDWEWTSKEKIKMEKTSREKINFQFLVAEKYLRKGGSDVKIKSTLEMKEKFNLRDVQSGTWVLKDPASAMWHVDKMSEGFSDMCDIVGIPENKVSMNGRLAMAIGARGTGNAGWQGAAKAHYEPVERVINITKMKGGGSLAHEWFHAFDNLITDAMSGENTDAMLTNPLLGMSRAAQNTVSEILKLRKDPQLSNSWAKRRELYMLEKKAEKKGWSIPVIEASTNPVKNAFNDLVIAMTEGTEPIKTKVFFDEKDYKIGAYLFDDPKGESYIGVASSKTLDDAIAYIDKNPINVLDKDSLIRATVAWFAKSEDVSQTEGSRRVDLGEIGSTYLEDAKDLDDGKDYWSSPHEMAARAFSAYVDDKLRAEDRYNDYLAYATQNKFYRTPFGDQRPYPEGEERERINTAFENLFNVVKAEKAIRKALDIVDSKPIKDIGIYCVVRRQTSDELLKALGAKNSKKKILGMACVIKKSSYNELMKSGKDTSKLQRKVITNKNGKRQTVWVSAEKKDTTDKQKRTATEYKGIDKIADFMERYLKKVGFEIETSGSSLSSSRYITIKNWQDITGKESKYNNDELKIRVSNHDLPPSYDGLHGYEDVDIYTDGQRMGAGGDAENYLTAIKDIAKQAKKPLPMHVKNIEEGKKQDEERRAENARLRKEKDESTKKDIGELAYLKQKIREGLGNRATEAYSELLEYAKENNKDVYDKANAIDKYVEENKLTGDKRRKQLGKKRLLLREQE